MSKKRIHTEDRIVVTGLFSSVLKPAGQVQARTRIWEIVGDVLNEIVPDSNPVCEPW